MNVRKLAHEYLIQRSKRRASMLGTLLFSLSWIIMGLLNLWEKTALFHDYLALWSLCGLPITILLVIGFSYCVAMGLAGYDPGHKVYRCATPSTQIHRNSHYTSWIGLMLAMLVSMLLSVPLALTPLIEIFHGGLLLIGLTLWPTLVFFYMFFWNCLRGCYICALCLTTFPTVLYTSTTLESDSDDEIESIQMLTRNDPLFP